MSEMYLASDLERRHATDKKQVEEEAYRTQFRRDYARVLHSPSFRRLQGKTQLFPNWESDYFRNRLTHSLEVAQIAKSIAIRLNNTEEFLKDAEHKIDLDLCELAGLAHDLGHPPFGHNGEKALDRMMAKSGGFEGNAQTLRILCRLEKKEQLTDFPAGIDNNKNDGRLGLNLTYRSLASVLKYDYLIPQQVESQREKPKKGYYQSEKSIVDEIKSHVQSGIQCGDFRTIECSIMDLADDIAYSTYDLEDAFKAGFTTPLQVISTEDSVLEKIKNAMRTDLSIQDIRDILFWFFAPATNTSDNSFFDSKDKVYKLITSSYHASLSLARDAFLRNKQTSDIVGYFINSIEFVPNKDRPSLSSVQFPSEVKKEVEVLKQFAYVTIINSPMLKIVEYRGSDIVESVFSAIKESTENSDNSLLPDDFREVYEAVSDEEKDRVICDFVAGMTDRYALEFYGRLYSDHAQSIFKPL